MACGSADNAQKDAEGKKHPSTHKIAKAGADGEMAKEEGGKATEVSQAAVAKKHFGPLPYKKMSPDFKPKKAPSKPNVILLVLDAINVKHMSAYGYRRNTTPNLSKLAKKGMVFTNYISNSSWTRPSFTTIITGMTKKEHGVELKNRDVKMEITTIAEHFRAAGYRTAGFTGNPLTRGVWGFNQGYQVYEDTHSMDRIFPPDGWLTDRAVSWMNRSPGQPFFLKIFFTAPHAPYRPLESHKHFVNQVKGGEVVEYPFREYKTPLKKADHQKTVAAYDDEIRYTDAQIGELVATLQKTGAAKNTAIIVTGDHGELFGQHNSYTHAYHMWEEALRVPFVMYLPWSQTQGVFNDELFTHVDILPTTLDVAGIEYQNPEKLTGRSILEGIGDGQHKEKFHLSQYNAHGIQREAVRRGPYKLIHHHKVPLGALDRLNQLHESLPHADPRNLPSLALDGERYEFYHLINDPTEANDLYDTMKDSKQYKALQNFLAPSLGELVEDDNQLSPEMIEALRNAGYMQ